MDDFPFVGDQQDIERAIRQQRGTMLITMSEDDFCQYPHLFWG